MTAFEGEGEAYEAVFDRISRGSSLGDADVRQLLGEASKRKDEGCVAIEKRDMAMEEARHIACEILDVYKRQPTLDAPDFFGSEVTHDLASFKERCDLVAANRWSDDLADIAGKVYTRDLFRRD